MNAMYSDHPRSGEIVQGKDHHARTSSTKWLDKSVIVKEFWVTLNSGAQLLVQKRYRQTLHGGIGKSEFYRKSAPTLLSVAVLKGDITPGWDATTVLPAPHEFTDHIPHDEGGDISV